MDKELLLSKLKDKDIELYYVDYNDNLSSEQLQECFHNPEEWYPEEYHDTWESIQYILKETFNEDELDLIESDEDLRQEIIDYIYSNDTSNLGEELFSNTNDKQCFYDTGISVYDTKESLRSGLRQLGIKLRDNESSIKELLEWNYYGGNLEILFKPDNKDLYNNCMKMNGKTIEFSNPCIGLSDRSQGTGGFAEFIGTIRLPFNRECIYVEREGYGYSLCEVYGDNDLGDSQYKILDIKRKQLEVNPEVKKYKEWDKDLKKGICHIGDPRYSSHDTEYINNFPCGNRCKRCNKFFID